MVKARQLWQQLPSGVYHDRLEYCLHITAKLEYQLDGRIRATNYLFCACFDLDSDKTST